MAPCADNDWEWHEGKCFFLSGHAWPARDCKHRSGGEKASMRRVGRRMVVAEKMTAPGGIFETDFGPAKTKRPIRDFSHLPKASLKPKFAACQAAAGLDKRTATEISEKENSP